MADAGANTAVREVLESLVAEGPEIGLQVAAYLDGTLVVDTWAGLADPSSGRNVDGDTLFMLSSTTKGVTATCAHVLAGQGKLDYDRPMAYYWPEFGAHGKDRVTVRDVMAQRSGIPQTPVGYTPEWLADWDRMCRGIADLTPMFEPGQRTAYASLTYGHMVGEVIRRIDGRPIGQFLREEICEPLGSIDLFLGVPDAELSRIAVLTDAPPAPAEYDARMVGEPAGSQSGRGVQPPRGPAGGRPGLGRDHERARTGAALRDAGQRRGARRRAGSVVRGNPARHRIADFEWDEIYRIRVRRALGYRRGPDCGPHPGPSAFGHVGGGGSFGYADPDRHFAIGFAKNYFTYATGSTGPAPRRAGQAVADAVINALKI